MSRRVPLAMLAALLAAGCAAYRPAPLSDSPAVLAPPVLAVLARDAAAIDRPWLHPVSVDLSQPLDPVAVAAIAVVANPDLKAQRTRAGVSGAQAFAAGLLPDPSFSFGLDKVLSGPDMALGITSALGLDLAALRNRGVVRAQTSAQARQVRLDLAWSEWQTAGQARIQAARILFLERSVALAQASRDSTQSLLDRTLRAAGRGDILPDSAQAARLAAFDSADRLRTAEQELGTARVELVRLLGLPPGFAIRLAPFAPKPPPPDAARLFDIAVRERTDLQALRAGYDAQEAAVHKAILDQFPKLDLALNVNRDTAGNFTIGPAVALTLPLWNRNRGGIAVESATRAALKAEYEARLFQARSEIYGAVGALERLRGQRAAIVRDLPAMQRFAEATGRAAGRGDLPLSTAMTAGQALRDKQSQLALADRSIAEQTIALELLTGVPEESWPRETGTQ